MGIMKKFAILIIVALLFSPLALASNQCCGKASTYWASWDNFFNDAQMDSFLYDVNNDISADYDTVSIFGSELNKSIVGDIFSLQSSFQNDAKKEILALYLNLASSKLLLDSCYFIIEEEPTSVEDLVNNVHSEYGSNDFDSAKDSASFMNTNCGGFADAEIPEFSTAFLVVLAVAGFGIFLIFRKRYT